MRSAESNTRRIRESVNLEDLIAEQLTLKQAGNTLKGLCPFHEEKTPSFTVWPGQQTFHCFGCGAGGDVFTFVQLREGLGFREARQVLADRCGIDLSEESGSSGAAVGRADLAKACAWAADWFRARLRDRQAGEAVRDYLKRRGVSVEQTGAFELGLAVDSFDSLLRAASTKGLSTELLLASGLIKQKQEGGYYDVFRNRLMFPIRDPMGRVIGFGGRALDDNPAKYLNSPQTALFDKGSCLYGIDRARESIKTNGFAIVVEGYMDCIMSHQHGFANTVATLGTAMTEAHLTLLRRYTDTVVCVFDADRAGEAATERVIDLGLKKDVRIKVAQVPEGKDPCDCLVLRGAEFYRASLAAALDALEFRWRQTARKFTGETPLHEKKEAVERFVASVAASCHYGKTDAITRGLLANQLAKVLAISVAEVLALLSNSQAAHSRQAGASVAEEKRPALGSTPRGETDALQVSLRTLLEIAVVEPGYIANMEERLDPSRFADRQLAAIAAAARRLYESYGDFALTELTEQFNNPSDAARIISLDLAGRRMENFDEAVATTLDRLRQLENAEWASSISRRLQAVPGGRLIGDEEAETVETESLRQFHARAGGCSHSFLPRSLKGALER